MLTKELLVNAINALQDDTEPPRFAVLSKWQYENDEIRQFFQASCKNIYVGNKLVWQREDTNHE